MSPTDELTMVLVTRQDLQLSKGKLAAQCAHASAECVLSAKKSNPRSLDRYLRGGARKIVCKVPDLVSLKEVHSRAKKSDWFVIWLPTLDIQRYHLGPRLWLVSDPGPEIRSTRLPANFP